MCLHVYIDTSGFYCCMRSFCVDLTLYITHATGCALNFKFIIIFHSLTSISSKTKDKSGLHLIISVRIFSTRESYDNSQSQTYWLTKPIHSNFTLEILIFIVLFFIFNCRKYIFAWTISNNIIKMFWMSIKNFKIIVYLAT